jgi:AraC-like DNA-binding protein
MLRMASYWEATPAPRLCERVARISGSRDDAAQVEPIRVLPDGGLDLLFERELETGACRALAFGAKTTALVVEDQRPMTKLALHLAPGAAGVFGVPAAELCDRAVPLDALWPRLARELLERFAEGYARLFATLEDALTARSPRALENLAHRAARRIRARAGRQPIADVARAFGVSSRTLERAFRDHVGPSPKRFARIARLHAAHRALLAGGRGAEVALGAGYSDQPHMVRDFVELAGAPPLAACR